MLTRALLRLKRTMHLFGGREEREGGRGWREGGREGMEGGEGGRGGRGGCGGRDGCYTDPIGLYRDVWIAAIA